MRNKGSIDEYLAFLSLKYEVDPDKFFNALILATEKKESDCGNLSITCRNRLQGRTVILITKGSKVVAQFPVSDSFLRTQNNPLKNLRRTSMFQRRLTKRNMKAGSLCIKDLRTGMKQINLKAKVLEIAKPTLVFTRFGNYASVANAVIADETGKIKLCLWNEQINSVSEGSLVQIENARMSMYRGEKQLRIGKNGILNAEAELTVL